MQKLGSGSDYVDLRAMRVPAELTAAETAVAGPDVAAVVETYAVVAVDADLGVEGGGRWGGCPPGCSRSAR